MLSDTNKLSSAAHQYSGPLCIHLHTVRCYSGFGGLSVRAQVLIVSPRARACHAPVTRHVMLSVCAFLLASHKRGLIASDSLFVLALVVGRSIARSPMQANLSFLQAEEATALNCSKAWASLRKFESYFPNMSFGAQLNEPYCNSRAQCLALSKGAAEASGLNEGIALDAILLLDRLMHLSQETFSEVNNLHLCSCCLAHT